MSFLKKLPEGIRYSVSTPYKKMSSTLDLTKTNVCVIPERLKGVDCVVINANQLSYVAPDYEGTILLRYMDPFKKDNAVSYRCPTTEELNKLHQAYNQAKADSPLFFEYSLLKEGKETILPADLKFDRGRKVLNAHRTTLLDYTPVTGIVETMMPDPALARKVLRIKRHKRYILRCEAKKQDCSFIRQLCHKRTKISNTHPDRYA